MSNTTQTLSPEQQITFIIDALVDYLNEPAHSGRQDAIRSAAEQLQDYWRRFQAGELLPLPVDDDVPF